MSNIAATIARRLAAGRAGRIGRAQAGKLISLAVAATALVALGSHGAEAAYRTNAFDPFGLFGQEREDARPAASGIPREVVAFPAQYGAGTIIVSVTERRLYFVLGNGQAIRYGVGVGRPGFDWAGTKVVSRKAEWPAWTPPPEMLKRRPDLPRHMLGGPENPLGARAMYLGGSLYRIHGSNEPDSIGQAVSSGCIRMLNEDVVDLYERVRIGTRVVVMR